MKQLASHILVCLATIWFVWGCQWFRFIPTTQPSKATPTPTPAIANERAQWPEFIIVPVAGMTVIDPTLCIRGKGVLECWNATGIGERNLIFSCNDPRFSFLPNPLTFSGSDHFESQVIYTDNGTPVETGEKIMFNSTTTEETKL